MNAGTRACLLALVVSTGACSVIGDLFKEPDIQLERAVVRGVDLTGGNLDLIVKVDNPNNFTLQGTRLEVGFDVEGQHLGDIAYDRERHDDPHPTPEVRVDRRGERGAGGARIWRSAL